MAQWLKALRDSYRGPRHFFILSGDGNFGKKLQSWMVILGPRFLSRSLLPMKDSLSHTFLHDVLSKGMRPGSLSEIGNPHESPQVRYFPQIFDGQITPHPPALVIPCPLHSIMVTKALSIFKASGEPDSVPQVLIFFCSLMHFHREAIFKADRTTFALLDT